MPFPVPIPAGLNPGDEAAPDTPGTGDVPCPVCQGRGNIDQKPCSNCGGTGKVVRGIGGA